MSLFHNLPLWSALIAIVFAQVIKVPIRAIADKRLQPDLAFSTGGMPSSHSAAVAALTTSIGFESGLDSPYSLLPSFLASSSCLMHPESEGKQASKPSC